MPQAMFCFSNTTTISLPFWKAYNIVYIETGCEEADNIETKNNPPGKMSPLSALPAN